uniref:Uncharacterized protein n=1 Tax=Leersia perrieri TaxID=77586 RepID=A0A0D9XIR0_9ORYZ
MDEITKESSTNLATNVASLILVSYGARDPGFDPYVPTEDFPAGTDEQARAQVQDAVQAIVAGFEGTEARIQLAYDSDHGEVEEEEDVEDASAP